MSRDTERDPVLRRAIDELRKMPEADARTVRRVVAAAAAARVTPSDDQPVLRPPRRPYRFWSVAGIAAAAAFVGFALSSARRERPAVDTVAPSTAASRLQPVANSASEAVPINRQFVFNDPRAHSVSLVGDFNGWNPRRSPMVREMNSGLWSITLPIVPGRHTYGFMVNDSVFALDPHAPKAHDRDLGADGSVIIVGKP